MLIFSDLHSHIHHPVVGNDFIDLSVNALQQIREFSIQTGDKDIIHLGDWSHLKDRIYTKVWNSFFKELAEWEKQGIVSYWLKGNHDFDNDISISAFNISPWTIPITKPLITTIQEIQCVFLPFGSTKKDLEELNVDYSTATVLFIHDYIKGISQITDTIVATDGWDIGYLSKFPFAFAGHSHSFQEILRGRIYHVGSPYQVSFNEVGQEKYFLQFDGKSIDTYNFLFPQFVELNMDEEIEDKHILPNSYVKLKYSHDMWTNNEVEKFKQKLLDMGVKSVKAESIRTKKEGTKRMEIKENTTDSDFMVNYINLCDTSLDKSLLFKIGQQIMDIK